MIYDAVARGDGPAASAAMLQHLKNVEATLVDALRRYQGAIAGLPREPTGPVEEGASPEGRTTMPRVGRDLA